jgi:hypothetical protein
VAQKTYSDARKMKVLLLLASLTVGLRAQSCSYSSVCSDHTICKYQVRPLPSVLLALSLLSPSILVVAPWWRRGMFSSLSTECAVDLVVSTEIGAVACVWVITGPYIYCVTLLPSHNPVQPLPRYFCIYLTSNTEAKCKIVGHIDLSLSVNIYQIIHYHLQELYRLSHNNITTFCSYCLAF